MTTPNTEELRHRLKRRRADMSGRLEDVARWSGLSVERLRDIEDGPGPFNVNEFEQICRGLAVSPGAMYRSEEKTPALSVLRFRSALEETGPLNFRDLRLLTSIACFGRTLGDLANLSRYPIPFTKFRETIGVDSRLELWEQGYRLGEAARERLGIPAGPLESVEGILKELGVHVARIKLDNSTIEAASLWEPGAVPIILLNTKVSRVHYGLARRAILAHELCHLLHDTGEENLTTYVSSAEGDGNYSTDIERRARAFAPAFIAPRDQTRRRLQKKKRIRLDNKKLVRSIAKDWGFSWEGAAWHARNCNYIGPEKAKQLSSQGYRPRDEDWDESFETEMSSGYPPQLMSSDLPSEVSDVCKGKAELIISSAYMQGDVSLGRARELLSWE